MGQRRGDALSWQSCSVVSTDLELAPEPARLALRPARSIRARKHPWAVAGLWAWQIPFALVVSSPLAALVASTYGRGANGDAVLWTPGGHALLAFAVQQEAGLRAIGTLAGIAWGSSLFLGMIPMAMAMIAMSHAASNPASVATTPTFATCALLSLRLWPKLVKLLLVFALADGLLLAVGGAVALATATWTHRSLGEARSQQLAVGIGALFLLAAMALHVMHDISRAFLVCAGGREFGAIETAVRTFRRAPLALGWAWAWRASTALAAVLAGAVLARPVGGRGGFALALLALAHQMIVLARASLRASWLARALRAAASARPRSAD
jgi:hypothetical protein